MNNPYYIIDMDKESFSETEKYFAVMVLMHTLYAVESNGGVGDLTTHKEQFGYYVNNELYFNRADDEILDDLTHYDLQRIKELVLDTLTSIRELFDVSKHTLKFFINEHKVGVTYVSNSGCNS